MSRSESPRNLPSIEEGNDEVTWPGVYRQYGRLHVVTDDDGPIEEPTVPDDWTPPQWALARAEIELIKQQRVRLLKRLLVVLAAAIGFALAAGCATVTPVTERIVLPERLGTTAALVISSLVGQEPRAATIPGGPIVIFQPADADDTCLWAHEQAHRRQQEEMGTIAWEVEYATEYADCRKGGYSSSWCVHTIRLEAEAYRAQHACSAGGHATGRSEARWFGRYLAKEEARP